MSPMASAGVWGCRPRATHGACGRGYGPVGQWHGLVGRRDARARDHEHVLARTHVEAWAGGELRLDRNAELLGDRRPAGSSAKRPHMAAP